MTAHLLDDDVEFVVAPDADADAMAGAIGPPMKTSRRSSTYMIFSAKACPP
jgi:hypothetical protein